MSTRGYTPMNYQRHYHWMRSRQLLVSIWTIAINRSMSQTGHDPHGYNPLNYQRHYHQHQLCQPYNNNELINVLNRTLSIWLQSRELSMPLPPGTIFIAMSTRQQQLIDQCLKHSTTTGRDLKATILICMFQRNHNYSQHSNQSGVSISTDLFETYMLQVKVYRLKYNSYLVIYIT